MNIIMLMQFIKLLTGVMVVMITTIPSYGQTLPVPRNIQLTYAKGTRSTAGSPGKNYWQNNADYRINVSYAPDTRLLNGTVEIQYINNSPDTLKQVWFKLYPNLYKKGTPRQSAISPKDLTDGVSLDSFSMDGQAVDKRLIGINGTNMTLNRQSIGHGKSVRFSIVYHYT